VLQHGQGPLRAERGLERCEKRVEGGGERGGAGRPRGPWKLGGPPRWYHTSEPPRPKSVDRWTEKRALFGVYDNIGILGNFQIHPKELIRGPKWLRGFRGNELQRCIRKMKMVGDNMFEDDYKNLTKRIKFLSKRFNRTGKHR
uniref:Large ribosomal subunit protein mL51 n=1 Tax=Sphenodon punctatus TaxID=8508 RepID=A0A8D0HJ99_SPHPU